MAAVAAGGNRRLAHGIAPCCVTMPLTGAMHFAVHRCRHHNVSVKQVAKGQWYLRGIHPVLRWLAAAPGDRLSFQSTGPGAARVTLVKAAAVQVGPACCCLPPASCLPLAYSKLACCMRCAALN